MQTLSSQPVKPLLKQAALKRGSTVLILSFQLEFRGNRIVFTSRSFIILLSELLLKRKAVLIKVMINKLIIGWKNNFPAPVVRVLIVIVNKPPRTL
jgi:hypothetical protein